MGVEEHNNTRCKSTLLAFIAGTALLSCSQGWAQEGERQIDASDPTKIYTYAGLGMKYNDYTNGDYMVELRLVGNLGLSENDTLLFEGGYGSHRGLFLPTEDDQDWTDFRFRWFHVFSVDYNIEKGYRGWSTQVDLQLAGSLKGTDGQNQLALGVMPVYALGGAWNLYLQLNVVSAWDKSFSKYNGSGPAIAPQFVYSPDGFWRGAQLQIIPQYTYFMNGNLDGEGSGKLEVNVGGEFTPTVMWDITYEEFFDLDLKSLRKDVTREELENDWNLFFNVTTYF